MHNADKIEEIEINSIEELIEKVLKLKLRGSKIYFRGENNDYKATAFQPSIYRDGLIINEHKIYRECQRYNQSDFSDDLTTFEKLTRMQHYGIPTRMIDLSEDLLSALFFSFYGNNTSNNCCLYAIEIDESQIKYYDSDSVSVVTNLAKSPLINIANNIKSKKYISQIANKCIKNSSENSFKDFNNDPSIQYLIHDIKEEKPYFVNSIIPKDIFSIFCIKPKLNNQRINKQKGAFLAFGLNKDDYEKQIPIISKNENGDYYIDRTHKHPILNITKFILNVTQHKDMHRKLSSLGVTLPYIYPELDKVAEYLKETYKRDKVIDSFISWIKLNEFVKVFSQPGNEIIIAQEKFGSRVKYDSKTIMDFINAKTNATKYNNFHQIINDCEDEIRQLRNLEQNDRLDIDYDGYILSFLSAKESINGKCFTIRAFTEEDKKISEQRLNFPNYNEEYND